MPFAAPAVDDASPNPTSIVGLYRAPVGLGGHSQWLRMYWFASSIPGGEMPLAILTQNVESLPSGT
jgi:hypothetical protein